MAFTDDEMYELLNFFGYGQAEADLWFLVSHENSGSIADLEQRLQLEPLISKERALDSLGISWQTFDEQHLGGQGIALAKLYLILAGKKPNAIDASYLAQGKLFTEQHNSFLVPFYSIPESQEFRQKINSILPKFADHPIYRQKAGKLRSEFLREALDQYKPKLILVAMEEDDQAMEDFFAGYKMSSQNFFTAGWDIDTVVIKIQQLALLTEEQMVELADYITENCLPIDPMRDFGPLKLSKTEQAHIAKKTAQAAAFAKRKSNTKHNASDPYCVCEECLRYDR